ncbi:hypothetical protein TTE2755 [Caldanaerobacter subterraneus subsp. tengcongensis MB4]|uniref:Uncharacterized protein n=1 Tax=Caldanaerobacter subterraneus subsp. tengcongensis (strain DSM 15242 / JCM 11007 / NBRC 100824 / MB4) TaxID=273068 RepID=Q8R6P3_CALS4|nr:hypothetical protein TTE2755 [Caldanaerobacter subterraneus subsp. tengcongensis MB4]
MTLCKSGDFLVAKVGIFLYNFVYFYFTINTFYKIKNSIKTKLESGKFKNLKEETKSLKIIQEGKISLYYMYFKEKTKSIHS